MNRYLKISFNLCVGSIIPIICWFFIGMILDKQLINVFSITYPLQFLYSVLLHIFGTGANINKEKNKNENIVFSSFLIGSIITILIFGFIAINVDNYLRFFGYDIETYKIFTLYSILFLGLSVIFYILIEKLYFEDRESLAIKYCLIFNLTNFLTLIGSAIITKNQCISTFLALFVAIIYIIFIFIKLFDLKHFTFNIFKNFIYESSSICSDILFLIVFLFGLKNVNSYGIEYLGAVNFVALVTDTQWDSLEAVTIIAKIDIAKERFNNKKHLIYAYKLTALLLSTSIIMMFTLYKNYNLDILLVLKYFSFEFFNFLIWVKYATDNVLLQLKYSAFKSTSIKFIANIVRFTISLLPTPFCTACGQFTSSLIQFLSYHFMVKKHKKKT